MGEISHTAGKVVSCCCLIQSLFIKIHFLFVNTIIHFKLILFSAYSRQFARFPRYETCRSVEKFISQHCQKGYICKFDISRNIGLYKAYLSWNKHHMHSQDQRSNNLLSEFVLISETYTLLSL